MTLSPAHLRLMEALQTVDERPRLAHYTAPLRLASSQNGSRGRSMAGIRATAAKKAHQRRVGWVAGEAFKRKLSAGAAFHVVVLVRVGPKELDDDNLAAAFKSVRDGCALALGVNDRDPRVRYLVDQERGAWGVRLEFYASMQRDEKPVTREVLTDFGPPSEFTGPSSSAWKDYAKARATANTTRRGR